MFINGLSGSFNKPTNFVRVELGFSHWTYPLSWVNSSTVWIEQVAAGAWMVFKLVSLFKKVFN